MRQTLTLVVLLTVLMLTACENNSSSNVNSSATPTPNPATQVAEAEAKFQAESDFDAVFRSEARKAAIEFLKRVAPNWKVKGLSSQPYDPNVFWISADLENGKATAVLLLVAKKFFPENGDPYWRVTAFSSDIDEQLHDLSDDAIQKSLDKMRARFGEPE